MITFYGYTRCDTCRRAKKALDGAGIALETRDITSDPPGAADILRWLEAGLVERKDLLNTSGAEYRTTGLKETWQALSTHQFAERLASNGRLIKRPLITDGKGLTVGFRDPQAILAVWKRGRPD